MTGAKAWRQKGTGRARVGALSVPHRRGGGVAFGPKPRKHTFKVNRKARRRALRSALSVHSERGSVAVLDPGALTEPSTKTAAGLLGKWGANEPTLVVVDPEETAVTLSFRNLPRVDVLPASAVGVGDIVGHASLVLTQQALEVLEARAGDVERVGSDTQALSPPAPRRPRGQTRSGPDAEAADPGGKDEDGGAS